MGKIHAYTERSMAEAEGLDTWEDAEILSLLAASQARAIQSVSAAAARIAEAADGVAARIRAGGKLYYAGAGSSIRIGVQDGSELHATFGFAEDRVGYFIAGGRAALTETLADAEDDEAAGEAAELACEPSDAVIAIAASGKTPYTLAVARSARAKGAFVVAVVNNPDSPLAKAADVAIELASGPEVISGSTRLAAGTAQKAALNLLSTLAFIKLGAVHDGYMVNVVTGNSKLRERARRIVAAIAGCDEQAAARALDASGGSVKLAVLMCSGAASPAAAQNLLKGSGDNLRVALSRLRHGSAVD